MFFYTYTKNYIFSYIIDIKKFRRCQTLEIKRLLLILYNNKTLNTMYCFLCFQTLLVCNKIKKGN